MSVIRDLNGQRFGRLTAVSYLGIEKSVSVWLCKCDCGNFTKVRASNLLQGNSKSCGCLALELKRHDVEEVRNKKFGLLRVIQEVVNSSHEDLKQRYLYECECDCGKIITARASLVRNGSIKSCGCLKKKHVDMVGKEYGSLKVIGRSSLYSREAKAYPWLCKCSCGKEVSATYHELVRGIITSCGCAVNENKIIKIGKDPTRKRLYGIWRALLSRCYNPNNLSYNNYGARGILVSEEWKSFERFCLDVGNPPSHKHQLDRVDNSIGYSKENCRWIISKQNNRNRSNNRFITINDVTKCVSEWAEEFGIDRHTLLYRINSGWPNEKLSAPKYSRV